MAFSFPAMVRFVLLGVVAFSGFSLTSRAVAEENREWLSWRGPNRDSKLEGQAWPATLTESNFKMVWSVPFGDSYSGPIVTADSVFTTETISGNERVTCVDRKTGETRWSKEWEGSMKVPFFAARNGSWIRATPVSDGQTIFVGGIRDVLVALDCKTGEEKWRLDFGKEFGKVPDFGMVCSPLLDGDDLYIQAGKGLHKLNKNDGKIVWSSLGDNGDMMSSGAFSSPVIATISDKRQLLVQTRTYLAGVDMTSGSKLWSKSIESFRGMNILTPTVWNNGVFTSSYGGRSLLLNVSGDSANALWENKLEGYMSSPIVIGQHLYMHLRNKRFACIDLEQGKETWVTRPYGEYWSMVSNGQRILALDQAGKLRLIAHNPSEYEMLGELEITQEEAWAHIAVAGSDVVIRTQKSLQLYRWQD